MVIDNILERIRHYRVNKGFTYREISELETVPLRKSKIGEICVENGWQKGHRTSPKKLLVQEALAQENASKSSVSSTPDEGEYPPTNRRWKGETPRYDDKGEITDWLGPKVEPSLINWYRVFKDDPDGWNPYFPAGDVHDEICGIIESMDMGDVLQILMARDHFKTMIVQENTALYHICEQSEYAQKGLLIITWSPRLAERTFNSIIEHLSWNPRILSFYGYLVDDVKRVERGKRRRFSTGTAFFKYQGAGKAAGIRCTSFQSGDITGWHPGIAFLDDIEDKRLSETYMERFREVFLKKLIPAISKTGIVIITGTIKGYSVGDDIYLLLESNPEYMTYKYPAVVNALTGEADFPPMSDVVYERHLVPVLNKRTGNPIYNQRGEVKMRSRTVILEIKHREQYHVTFPEKFTLEELVKIRLKYRFGEVKNMTDDDFFSEYQLTASNPKGKVFNMDRVFFYPPTLSGERAFFNFQDFAKWCGDQSHPVCMFMDPGGKTGHGIAMVVLAYVAGERWGEKFVILDVKISDRGLPETAAMVMRLVDKWGVDDVGCEGNWDDAETYAHTIEREFYRACENAGRMDLYRPIPAYPNRGEKLLRINTHVSSMIGADELPERFFVNPESELFERYKNELTGFGFEMSLQELKGFDCLDATASVDIHMLKTVRLYMHAV